MSVSIADILAAARVGEVALVGEVCGYLALGAADAVLSTGALPLPRAIRLNDDGHIEVVSEPARPEVQEVVLRQVLGELLAEVRTPFPNLSRVASRDETRGLGSLVTELEAALVPVNRRAAKRSLSRLSRETHRALERGLIVPEVSPSDTLEPEAPGSAANMGPQVPREEDAVTPHWAASPEVTARAMFAAPAPSHRVSPPAPAPAPSHSAPAHRMSPPAPAPAHSAPSHSAPAHSAPSHSAPSHSAPAHSAPSHSAPASSLLSLFDPAPRTATESAPDTVRAPPDPFDEEPTIVIAPVEESLTDLIAELRAASAQVAPIEGIVREEDFEIPVEMDELQEPAPETIATPRPTWSESSEAARPALDRFRTARPRSDLPPQNPTPLIAPSDSRAPHSDLEGLLSALKPPVQPEHLQDTLEALVPSELPGRS